MILLLIIAVMVVLIVVRVPVVIAILAPSIAYMIFIGDLSLRIVVQQIVGGVDSFTLLAVPMFVLVGEIANRSGMAEKLFDFVRLLLWRSRGALGYVNVATSAMFSTINGSPVADAASIGSVQIPAMVKSGFRRDFAIGLTGAGTLLGGIIPPSIPTIIYAVTASLSVGAMFAAGILPGLVLAAALCVNVFIYVRRHKLPPGERPTGSQLGRSSLAALPLLGAPVILVGGIIGGIFTPTEASVVSVLYLLVIAIASRALTVKATLAGLLAAAKTSVSVLVIIGASEILSWILAKEGAPQIVATFLLSLTSDPVVFLLIVNVLLLVIGTFLEPPPAILILVPILGPIATSFGINPIHFSMIVLLNLLIGILTPPVGAVLFILGKVGDAPMKDVIRGIMPFFATLIAVLMVVTYVPAVSLFIPGLLGL